MDIKLIDTGDGGEMEYNGHDIVIIEGLGNQVYLAMFGGNAGYNTPFERLSNEQGYDFWGNAYLEKGQQFNSYTEYALNNNTLSSFGRSEIEKAVKKDLEYMADFSNTSMSVAILDEKRISISISIIEPTNVENREYRYIWDASKNELTTD